MKEQINIYKLLLFVKMAKNLSNLSLPQLLNNLNPEAWHTDIENIKHCNARNIVCGSCAENNQGICSFE